MGLSKCECNRCLFATRLGTRATYEQSWTRAAQRVSSVTTTKRGNCNRSFLVDL